MHVSHSQENSMFNNFSDALGYLQKKKIRTVDLKFIDLWGRWHHVSISASEFVPTLMEEGIGFDGSSIGLKSVKSGDMALLPDISTGVIDTFWEPPVLSFICSTVEADTKTVFGSDPRVIAQRAEQFLIKSGIADESRWGPEYEFYLFNNIKIENTVNTALYSIDSVEGSWNRKENGNGYEIPPHGGYHAIPPTDHFYQIREEMVHSLEDLGIPVKYHHHEVGGPGQCEIETPIMGLIAAADSAMTIKYVVKMIAARHGLTATFLPKPLFGEAGSGMHFHQQLFLAKKNIFYDVKSDNLLSEKALYYIGGLLYHAPAVLAFTNPSTNSYRRLVPGFEAPVNCFFSSGNRSAAIRVPKYATIPEKVRFEFRPPDATCNPYLAISAMLMAGLDGIVKKIDPTKSGFGPINDDIFSWSSEKRKTIKQLPTSLGESLNALHQDHEFLLEGNVFDEDLINLWIAKKSKEELDLVSRPHPYEIEAYYDF
jgi:glutamine synthetase